MKRAFLIASISLLPMAAVAQEAKPSPTETQCLYNQNRLVAQIMTLSDVLANTNANLTAANAKIEELTKKLKDAEAKTAPNVSSQTTLPPTQSDKK